jgi:hypothetical protein
MVRVYSWHVSFMGFPHFWFAGFWALAFVVLNIANYQSIDAFTCCRVLDFEV